MLAEITILLVLDVGIVLSGGGPEGIGAASFMPDTVFSPGLGVSLVFVVGSFIGFEATAIFAEEAKQPDKTIPRATYIAVLLISVFYAFSSWAIVQYYGPSQVRQVAASSFDNFYFNAAANILGEWSVGVISFLLIASLFACVLSLHNTLNRYFFALGREGIAVRMLGKVHAVHGSPYVAGMLQSALAAIVIIAFAVAQQDPVAIVFSYMSALTVIGILSVQAIVCIAIILFFKNNRRGHGIWQTLIAPSVAFVGLLVALVLVISNLELLAGTSSLVVDSFPLIVALTGLLGVAFALSMKRSDRARYDSLGKVLEH
jgi:amino acid transporter